MDLSLFEEFKDEFLRKPCGQGFFLAGILMGRIARKQVEGSGYSSSPLFKMLQMGRIDAKTLKRHLARVPDLIEAYDVGPKGCMYQLLNVAMERIAKCGSELGVDGNFAFTMGFVGAYDYWGKIFPAND